MAFVDNIAIDTDGTRGLKFQAKNQFASVSRLLGELLLIYQYINIHPTTLILPLVI
jgi:hypothetical protein